MVSPRPSGPVASAPVVIKKYANRRLYDTESSSYITLDHLAQMTREGRDFKVVDARSGEDITRSVLTQIIMDAENGDHTMLPVPFLRQLIALYGNSMQSMVPLYLEASMDALRKNQEQFRETMSGAFQGTPFEALARQNLAMFEKAAEMFAPPKPKPAVAEAVRTGADEEVSALREQLAALQAKLEKLGQG